MADHHFGRAFALACQDHGLKRDHKMALLRHATRRNIESSLDVRPEEITACWRALNDYTHWRVELVVVDEYEQGVHVRTVIQVREREGA